jgi:YD repeat-containing protein
MKTILALALTLFATEASFWVCGYTGTCLRDETIYDPSGRVIIARSSTDSQGTTTYYDARGNIIGRSSTSGDTTTLYDASGRIVGQKTNETPR